MCITLLAAGLSLLVPDTASKGAQIGPVVLFVYLFTIAYSLGEGPVAFQYSAEVFPTIQREQGMAWAVCINNTFGKLPDFYHHSKSRIYIYHQTTKANVITPFSQPESSPSHSPE